MWHNLPAGGSRWAFYTRKKTFIFVHQTFVVYSSMHFFLQHICCINMLSWIKLLPYFRRPLMTLCNLLLSHAWIWSTNIWGTSTNGWIINAHMWCFVSLQCNTINIYRPFMHVLHIFFFNQKKKKKYIVLMCKTRSLSFKKLKVAVRNVPKALKIPISIIRTIEVPLN